MALKLVASRFVASDTAAAALSSLCLLHCLALPLVLLLFPVAMVGGDVLHGPAALHWLLIALALPVSTVALWRGHGNHGGLLPAELAGGGFLLMATGATLHGGFAEPLLTVAGGLLVAFAHWRNRTLRKA